MTKSTPLTFFGSDDFAAEILGGLAGQYYPIKLIVTAPETAVSRQRQSNPVMGLAREHGLRAVQPVVLNDQFLQTLDDNKTEYAVLASYGKLLPGPVLERFSAIINVHPSLLPRWRGPSPVEAAILAGDDQTGVSLMKLAPKMDAGPVYASAKIKLRGHETQIGLSRKVSELGKRLLIDKLPAITNGRIAPAAQTDEQATYCPIIKKSDGVIDWNKPAVELERQIRAFQHWPRSRTKIMGTDAIINEAAVVDAQYPAGEVKIEDNKLLVGCGQGALEILKLVPAGRRPMTAQEFLRGYVR